MADAYTTYLIPGVKLASGRDAYGSKEMVTWLPLFLDYMHEVHGIDLIVIKVRDTSATAASASTHLGGWSIDVRSWNLTRRDREITIREATRLGLPIHYRITAQGFDPHLHGMLDVGYWTPCSYQINATRAGRSGLGAGGTKGADLDAALRPPVAQWLGYAAAVIQMRKEILALTPTQQEEEDMPLTEADRKLIATEVWNQMGTAGGAKSFGTMVAQSRVLDEAQSVALAGLAATMRSIQALLGADKLDEKVVAQLVVASLAGALQDTVSAVIQEALRDIKADEADVIATRVYQVFAEKIAVGV